MTPVLEILPAVDIVNGQAVRLSQGRVDSEESYGDPREAVNAFIEQGATWIHLVDLDLAFGRGNNFDLIDSIMSELEGVNVQLSGGIRDAETLDRALGAGPTRVNLSTLALADLDWVTSACAEHGQRVAVGLDVDGDELSARGWDHGVGNVWDTIDQLEAAGCSRYVVTDKTKDGTLEGPNVKLLRAVCERTTKPVVASGGVSSLSDIDEIASLTSIGVEGAIVGKALYTGAFTLRQALETVERGSHA